MKECEQFKKLYKAMQKYSMDARKPIKCFGCGRIYGYKWRLFQELDKDGKYSAWVGINDKTSEGTRWPVFYNEREIDEWVMLIVLDEALSM